MKIATSGPLTPPFHQAAHDRREGGPERGMRGVGDEVKLLARDDDVFSAQWDRWKGEHREPTRSYRDAAGVKPQKLPAHEDNRSRSAAERNDHRRRPVLIGAS
ncbi:hypothetical protein ACFV0L_09350 [Streptosporangium canum]|uniref:hypothetical protein n=1 Tax=Streptosporangium canum TaxID=324952 RepID=UPI0036CE1B9E